MSDLHPHVHLENSVLFPKAVELETARHCSEPVDLRRVRTCELELVDDDRGTRPERIVPHER
jgi:hypothetical protein